MELSEQYDKQLPELSNTKRGRINGHETNSKNKNIQRPVERHK
jgi:hypothetical protein